MTALERARELEQQRAAILQQATEELLAKAGAALKELREVVQEQIRSPR